MHGRLAEPAAAVGCLDTDEIRAFEALGLVKLDSDDALQQLADLRDYLRENVEQADARLAERFWSGRDVLELVHSRAWVVERLLLLASFRTVAQLLLIGLVLHWVFAPERGNAFVFAWMAAMS